MGANNFSDLVKDDGPVAIILTQLLRPVEGEGHPIFPPTYPMPTYRGRVHTVRDGEYRVSVELPPFRQDGDKAKKGESKSEDVAGYNIDTFEDGTNVCEIDSPQSQANRLEPLFKTVQNGKLVPQIEIRVGSTLVNLLDAGHRAADAVVRMSSLVEQFHQAFVAVKAGSHLKLAQIAPTSLLFGVWDSRGTQVKLPRILKAEIRATNVKKLTRSAQYNPACDYVTANAVNEALDEKAGDDNPLSVEGMKHVPAPRAAGGVKVSGEITRTVRVNLVALRQLRVLDDASKLDEDKTRELREYILGLVLVALAAELPWDLREGCLLVGKGAKAVKLVTTDGTEPAFDITPARAEAYAEKTAKVFFGETYESKDIRDATFESGVANEYLALKTEERKKIARSGPITAAAIKKFKEKGKDPFKLLNKSLGDAKKALGSKPKKGAAPIVNAEVFTSVRERLKELLDDELAPDAARELAESLLGFLTNDKDSHATCKEIEQKIKDFKKQQESATEEETEATGGDA